MASGCGNFDRGLGGSLPHYICEIRDMLGGAAFGYVFLLRRKPRAMPQELYEQLKILSQENCYTLPGYIRQVLKVHVREQDEN